jgi:hypothetical protein
MAMCGMQLVFLFSRQPGAYVWLMVIPEMVKELTGGEALVVPPHEIGGRFDLLNPYVIG